MELKLHHLYAISELIALLKVTHPDRHVCYCRLLQLSCLSVGIFPGCGHVVQLAGQWNHFARDPLDASDPTHARRASGVRGIMARYICISSSFWRTCWSNWTRRPNKKRTARWCRDRIQRELHRLHTDPLLSTQSSPGKCSTSSLTSFLIVSFIGFHLFLLFILTREVIDE
jgi:hypothetical protein